jgi:hypothetical protein
MKRRELEERLRTIEQKVHFMMHTLSLTRTNTTTGQTDAQTFDTLFTEAINRGMDPTTVADMARASLTRGAGRSVDPKARPTGGGPRTDPYPDGFARDDTSTASDRDL